ncbi:MAG: hypothetical protein HRT88_23600, partial [Lentisphaeraceae bacterium]|nr:hypothetical protein [Lentisphaeraceae bacterium]
MIKTWRFEQTVGLRNRRDGQKIFQKEKITLKEQGQSIDACVADSGSEHSVKLNFIVRSGLKAYCDCGRRELCEHVWATLLSCEKQALLKVAGGGPFSLRFDPQANDDDDDDDSLYIDEGPFVQTQKSLLKSRCPDLPPELLNEFALKLAHGDLSFSSLESILLENSAVYRRAGMKKWRDKSVSDYQFFVKSVCSELFAKTFFEIIKKSNKHEALEDLRETALENFEESIGGLDELQLNYDDEITLGSARENAVAVDEFDFAIPAKNVFVFTEEKKYKLKKVQRAKFELYVNFFENEHDQLSIDFSFLLNDEKFNKEEIFYLCKTGALVKGDWYVMSFVKILPLLETLDLLEDATFFEEDVEAMAQSLAHYPCEVKFSLKGVEQSFVKKPFVKNIELSGATKLSILPSFIYGEMTVYPF